MAYTEIRSINGKAVRDDTARTVANEAKTLAEEALAGGGGSGSGENGATFTPNVDAEGNLSWTNDKGLENPETVNIKGADGYTPVREVDYFTAADKAQLVNEVIAQLPTWNGGSY